MYSNPNFEELERQVAQLSPNRQLELVARISEKLSAYTFKMAPNKRNAKKHVETEQLASLDAWLAKCESVAELWEGEFDSAEDLRRIREE